MSVATLAQLQKLDSKIDAARRRLSELESLLADRQALAQAESEAAAAQAARQASHHQLRERELELQSLQTRIAELDQKLYSGRIRNPKELEGFEKEARMFKQNRDKLEEHVLNLMETAEQADHVVQSAQQKLDGLQTVRQQSEQTWQQETAQLHAQLAEQTQQVQALRADSDADELALYDRLRRHSILAVAPLRGNMCGVCGIGLSSDVLQRAQDQSASLAQCDNCGRILYGG